MKYVTHKMKHSGQAMLIAVVFFLMISLIVVLGVATPILKQVRNSIELVRSKETYFLAEAGIEDALYRLRLNKTVSTGDSITLNGSTITLNVAPILGGEIITSTANNANRIRKAEITAIIGTGISFNY